MVRLFCRRALSEFHIVTFVLNFKHILSLVGLQGVARLQENWHLPLLQKLVLRRKAR